MSGKRSGPSQSLRDSSPRRGGSQGNGQAGGGKRGELTCVSFVMMPDGRTVPVGELTAEEREQWRARMRERLSRGLGEYYTQHPDEYRKLKGRECK